MLTSDKVKIAAIARDLETVIQEMAAMGEETRALTALLTRVAEKLEANVAQFERPRMAAGRTSRPCHVPNGLPYPEHTESGQHGCADQAR